MKCPICKTECLSNLLCPTCGFSELISEFVSEEEYHYWQEHTVKPCLTMYKKMNVKVEKLEKELRELKKARLYPSVKSLFTSNGFRVVDNRSTGGALWVVGTQKELKPFVEMAKKQFNVTGHYGSGKATGYKDAWWTNEDK